MADMTSNQITENICQSIDTIIERRLEGLKYDKTDRCTIIDASQADIGKYYVNNGNAQYYAFNNNANITYQENENVYVLIPQNDYTKDKTILGRVINENNEAIEVKSPLDDIAIFKTYKLEGTSGYPLGGILANNPNIQKVALSSSETSSILNGIIKSDLQGFTRLAIELKANTFFPYDFIVSGDYGIKIEFSYGSFGQVFYTLDFNSKEFLGNIYNLNNFFTQYKVFSLPDDFLWEIQNQKLFIKISLFQNNNFEYFNGIKNISLPWQENQGEELITLNNNIIIDSIKLHFGRAKKDFETTNSMVVMYPKNAYREETEDIPLTTDIDNSSDSEENIQAELLSENNEIYYVYNYIFETKWFYKDINTEKYILFTSPQDVKFYFNKDLYFLLWYSYDETVEDQGIGINWKRLNFINNFSYFLQTSSPKIQMRCCIYDNFTSKNEVKYLSNTITGDFDERFSFINDKTSQKEYSFNKIAEANDVSIIASSMSYLEGSTTKYCETREISFGAAKMRLCANGNIQIYINNNWVDIIQEE